MLTTSCVVVAWTQGGHTITKSIPDGTLLRREEGTLSGNGCTGVASRLELEIDASHSNDDISRLGHLYVEILLAMLETAVKVC